MGIGILLETYVVHMTKLCNMDCIYCYEKDKRSVYSWGDIEEVIDGIVKYNKEFNIEFLGGEPMIEFNLIKKAYYYLQKITDVEVHGYTITTNGTIVSDEVIQFLKDNPKIRWAVSLDGTKYMNCLRILKGVEKNGYDLVVENLKKVLKEVNNSQISVHMVTHPYNVYLLAHGVDHLYNMGVRDIGIGTVESTIRIGQEYCKKYIEQLGIVSQRIKEGKYPNLRVDVLECLKPRSDVRYYMYDKEGKLVAESYGRSGEDITKSGDIDAKASSSPFKDMIEDIREEVYKIHQERMSGV